MSILNFFRRGKTKAQRLLDKQYNEAVVYAAHYRANEEYARAMAEMYEQRAERIERNRSPMFVTVPNVSSDDLRAIRAELSEDVDEQAS